MLDLVLFFVGYFILLASCSLLVGTLGFAMYLIAERWSLWNRPENEL